MKQSIESLTVSSWVNALVGLDDQQPLPGPKSHLEKDLMASHCLCPSWNLIHMSATDTSVWIAPQKPIKEQTLHQYSLQMRPGPIWRDERQRAERDCWLTSVVGCKSVHKHRETKAPAQDSYLSTKAISKEFLSTPAVSKYSQLEEVVDQFVSHLWLLSRGTL